MSDRRLLILTAIAAVVLAAAMMTMCALVAGASLGFWLAGLVVVTILLPPLCAQVRPTFHQAIVAACVNDTVGIAWLAATFASTTTLWQWLLSYALLAAYSFALWGIICAKPRWANPVFGSAIAMTIGLLWLTWPIWFSRASSNVVGWLTPAHPALALNGALKHLGIWSEHGLAYRQLTNLGQDVAYALPANVWIAVALHVLIGAIGFVSAAARRQLIAPAAS